MSLNINNPPRFKKDRNNNSARIAFEKPTVNPGLLGFDTDNSTPQTLEFPNSGNNNSAQWRDEIQPENVNETGGIDFLINSMYDEETTEFGSGRAVEGGTQATSFSEITNKMNRLQQR